MPIARLLLAALLSSAAIQGQPVPDPDPRHILGDLCARTDEVAPATHVYRLRDGGTVVFVAVAHVVDARSAAQRTAILDQVSAAFDRRRPDLVLVEGVSARKSDDDGYRAFLVDRARQDLAAGSIAENLWAVKLASDRGIGFSGWDLAPHDEYVADIRNGFDVSDAIGAHLLRARQNPFASPSPSAIDREVKAVPHLRQPDRFDFTAWYRRTYGERFDPKAGTPCGAGVASRIVSSESIARTLTIANLLGRYATSGKVVLVEAGSAHWAALRRYLESISIDGQKP